MILVALIGRWSKAHWTLPITNFDGRDNGCVRHEDSRVVFLYFRHRAARIEALAKKLTPLLASTVLLEYFRRNLAPMSASQNYEPSHRRPLIVFENSSMTQHITEFLRVTRDYLESQGE
nr:hypothetical protein [Paraburkholderia sp. BL8N3]